MLLSLKAGLKQLLNRLGYHLLPTRLYTASHGLYTLHGRHPSFNAALAPAYARGVQASNGTDPNFHWKIHTALWAATQAAQIPGNFLECGVNAGFAASAILEHLNWPDPTRRFLLIDTFAGPPLHQYSEQERAAGRLHHAQDALARGAYVTQLDQVHANFAQWPHAQVIQGTVPEIFSHIDTGPLAFLHLDLNIAQPEAEALTLLWPRLSPGAIVLLDDYCFSGHEAQTEALDSVATHLNVQILSLPTGQGLLLKP
jgi:hypothetical protein